MQYSISQPDFVYQGSFRSLDEIDPRNFVIHGFEGRRHLICGQLRKGYWEANEDIGMSSLRMLSTHRLVSSEPSAQFLLVLFAYSGYAASSDSSGFVQVWKLNQSRLTVEQQIEYNTHFQGSGPTEEFRVADQRLRVRASHYIPLDSHGHISAYDELTFRWTGVGYDLSRIETKRVQDISATKDATKSPKKSGI